MKTLVLGASGQLGQCIKKAAKIKGVDTAVFPNENEANILDFDLLSVLFNEVKPSYVINCAAYTAVDKAEDEIDICRKVNKEGVVNVAMLCRDYGAVLVHISTDFVFKGDQATLLKENDLAEPINIYGLTKLEGEKEIANILSDYYILRTSWLYSEYGANFVKTMLRLGSERDSLKVISDQIGTPTYAMDLAEAILDIIDSQIKEHGIYHYSNEGVTSWYDFAQAIFDVSGMPTKVFPITTSEYPTRAERPKFSVMNKNKFKSTFNLAVPYWRHSLQRCITAINQL